MSLYGNHGRNETELADYERRQDRDAQAEDCLNRRMRKEYAKLVAEDSIYEFMFKVIQAAQHDLDSNLDQAMVAFWNGDGKPLRDLIQASLVKEATYLAREPEGDNDPI